VTTLLGTARVRDKNITAPKRSVYVKTDAAAEIEREQMQKCNMAGHVLKT